VASSYFTISYGLFNNIAEQVHAEETLCVNLSRDTHYPEVFNDFSQLLQANSRIAHAGSLKSSIPWSGTTYGPV
jgi:hypothetical protein